MTNSDQKYPKSYSQRLSDFIAESATDTLTITEIQTLIKDFGALEYAKIQAKSDVMPMGKYKNKNIKVLCLFDRQYVDWLLEKKKLENYPEVKKNVYKYLKELDTSSD